MTDATGVAATPHNPAATAIEFFKALHGDGPTWLTAIAPNRTGIETKTCVSVAALTTFLGRYSGRRNLYYTLNRPRPGASPNKKPEKEDFVGGEVIALHVDVDPRAKETQEEAKARLLDWIAHRWPEELPKPTFVIYSGAGIQIIWMLDEAVPLNSLEEAEDIERYNKWILSLCDGDQNCFNIDRILRVPGFLNIPDERKIAKGRVPNDAEVLAFNPREIHPLSAFKQWPKENAPKADPTGPLQIDSINVKRVADVSELDRYDVPDRIKVIMVQGHHPDEPKQGDNSRSAWLYDVVCNLVRAKVPDDVIYGIITDPSFAISASVLDKGRSVHKYAVKQITDAKVDTEEFAKGGKDGKRVLDTPSNIELAIRRLGVRLSYDEFADRMLIEGLDGFGPVLRDEAVNRMRIRVAEQFELKTEKTFFYDVVQDIAWREKFHPVRDYLDELEWDGTERLASWLHVYAGTKDDDYTRAVGALALTAAVRRIRQPGCKFDEMVVFESPTGKDKSSALKLLAVKEAWFTDSMPLGRPPREVLEIIGGKWIIECAELEGLTPEKDANIKAFLSRTHDKARAAYGRLPVDVARQSVFFGTTNLNQYLHDTTGNRRYWPVKIERFDLNALKRDRDQLWAEAAVREAAGASIRLDQSLWAVAGEEQAARQNIHPWQERLDSLLGDRQGVIKGSDVWRLLEIPIGNLQQRHGAQIGSIMQALGFVRKQKRFGGSKPVGVYVRGDESITLDVRYTDRMGWAVHVERPKAIRDEQLNAPF
ncbi:virulence-associated E family protein [Bradyrhizobium sp. 145]|uniref:virulence-associated E family protein n=1 Tax=Bradyrhizobium sp. 145 TaxID=2782621 RepID=UPI001FFA3A5B|nr:virulence-associated E family protein [Bradyrhizobium sp. 145]MCK1684665.1 hypothetical protein [Bradyrhizobium sp. 145]